MYQLHAEFDQPMTDGAPHYTPAQLGHYFRGYLEQFVDCKVKSCSVREGLPVGARELPTEQIETLSQRLKFILDFIQINDDANGDNMTAIQELKELIADVEKAEGGA